MISVYRQAMPIYGRYEIRSEKDIKTERRGAGRRTANFAMISVYRRAMPIYGRYEIRREKRYQYGAERGEKKDCKFCDDLGVSVGKVDMRSLQVKLKKDIKTERRGARRRTANFAMISVYRRTMPICGRYEIRREKRYQDGAERDERKGERFFENFGAIRARSIPVGISCPY